MAQFQPAPPAKKQTNYYVLACNIAAMTLKQLRLANLVSDDLRTFLADSNWRRHLS